jgi:long-chain acyl-CoA synthetase
MEPTRIFDLLRFQETHFDLDVCLAMKTNGFWKTYSTKDVITIVDTLSRGLAAKGVVKDDKVAIISANRPEWNMVDLAVQQLGAVSVPMYPTITEKDYNYIFKDAGVKFVFVADEALYKKVNNSLDGVEGIEKIYSFDKISGAANWEEVLEIGRQNSQIDLEPLRSKVDPEDLLTLIYTSGTTGNPKGVMLTHHNILSNARAVSNIFPDFPQPLKVLSFLPLCHIFERTSSYFYIMRGMSIYYAENLETIGDNLKEVQPDMFTTVPRLLEKVYDKIMAKGYELSGIKKQLFFWAVNLGMKYDPTKDQGGWYNFQLKLANKIIFKKWREALGGNVKLVVSGGAALQPRLATIFNAAQISVREAYGLTETSPGVCFNQYEIENMRIGTVGPVLQDILVKIAPDGEILVKGPNIMKGYYKQPEKTAEVIDSDGWFHTGDIGEMIDGRFLKITDRKKEMFKTSGGKYVAPQLIENKFKESVLIEQVMVVGDGQKFPGALVVPNFVSLRDWCAKKEIAYSTDAEMIHHPKVVEKLHKEQEKLNADFAQFEKIKKIKLLPKLWTVENGELTAKLSLRRKIIEQNYAQDIAEIYKED